MQTLNLDAELTIFTAAAQKPRLLAFLDAGEALRCNLADVTEIDSAGLQLLILIKREALQAGKKLLFNQPSKAVLEILALTNLDAEWGDREAVR